MSSRLTFWQVVANAAVLVVVIAPMAIILAVACLVVAPLSLGSMMADVVLLLKRRKKMPIPDWMIAENHRLANQYAQKGTVKHFALRLGFMPHDEKDAEELLESVCDEYHELKSKYELLKKYHIG